jgi:hypothetical protein
MRGSAMVGPGSCAWASSARAPRSLRPALLLLLLLLLLLPALLLLLPALIPRRC